MESKTTLDLNGEGCSYIAAGEQNGSKESYVGATDGVPGGVEELAYATATETNTYAEVFLENPYEENPYLEPMKNGGGLDNAEYIEVEQSSSRPHQSLRASQTLPRVPGEHTTRRLESIDEDGSNMGRSMAGEKMMQETNELRKTLIRAFAVIGILFLLTNICFVWLFLSKYGKMEELEKKVDSWEQAISNWQRE